MQSIQACILSMSGRLRRPLLAITIPVVALACVLVSILSLSEEADAVAIKTDPADIELVQERYCNFAIETLQGDAISSYVAARPNKDTVVMFFDTEHPGSIRCEFERVASGGRIRLAAVMFDSGFIDRKAVNDINSAFAGRQAVGQNS